MKRKIIVLNEIFKGLAYVLLFIAIFLMSSATKLFGIGGGLFKITLGGTIIEWIVSILAFSLIIFLIRRKL